LGAWGTRARRAAVRAGLTLLLWGVGLTFLAPLLAMALISLRPEREATAGGFNVLPRLTGPGGEERSVAGVAYWADLAGAARENYVGAWESPVADFPRYFHNSAFVATMAVVGMVVSSCVVAYGFSRVRWPGRDALFGVVLLTLMVPPAVVVAPQYVLFKWLGWIGTSLPLWAPAWFGGAFGVFLLRQFFMTIPRELDEAARVDGATHVGVLLRVIVPMSAPVIAVVALVQFASVWNDFQGPLLFLNHQSQYTLAVGLQQFHQQHGGTPWNLVMAASVIVVAPVMLLYVLLRGTLTRGEVAGGVKE
jgi:multiple sugar transport system permease protein